MLLTLYFNNGLFHVIEKSWAIGWYGVHTSKKSVTIKSSPFTGIFRVTGKLDNIIKIIITAVTINAWRTSQQQQKTIYLFFLGGKTRTEAYYHHLGQVVLLEVLVAAPHFRSSLLNYRSKGSNTLVFWLEAWLLWYIVALSPSTYVVKKNKKNHEVFFVYVFFFFRDERGDNQIMLSKNGIFCTSDDEKFLIFFYYLLYYRFL